MTNSISNNDSVEEIIKKAKPDYLENLYLLKKKIQLEDIPKIEKERILQKIDFAIQRINTPLENWNKIRYILIPFGILIIFPKSGELESDKFEKYGFIKKEKEKYIFSTIGFVMYIAIGIIATRIL
ncbi:hypothetical protein [Gramella sp. KN1008]|uniref:hypothetical protein n=1 Tax=Gramella sp. KN1008 TaxID=2529298 RepID=UPI00103D30B3|nr:hypothetical protein [Gramella sp. KN1008]TBW25641.1 hypothetical protein EZJ28_15690 [Gramella sp. KN1008]